MFNSYASEMFIFAQWQFLRASVRQMYIIYKSANQREFRDCPCGCKIHFDILLQLQRFPTQNDKAQIDKKLVMQGTSTVMNLLIYVQNFMPHASFIYCKNSLRMVQNFSIARNIGTIMKRTHRYYLSFSSDTQQSNTSERERNRNLTDLYTQMWIEIGQSEKR